MKKLLVIIGLLVLIPACELEYGTAEEIEIGNIYDYDFEGSEEIPEFETIDEIALYVKNETDYIHDIDIWDVKDYWQTPEETYYSKTGDCEDRILLFQYILKKQLNIDTNFIIIKYDNKKQHVITKIDNTYYDFPSSVDNNAIILKYINLPNYAKLMYSIPYTEVLWMAINYHRLVGKYMIY